MIISQNQSLLCWGPEGKEITSSQWHVDGLDSRQEQLAADCIVCFRRQAKLIVTYAHMMTHILAMCPSPEDIWRTTKSIPYYVLRALHAWRDLSDSEEKERMIETWKRREICDLSAMPCFVYLCVLSEVLRKQYGAWHAGETWHALILCLMCVRHAPVLCLPCRKRGWSDLWPTIESLKSSEY